MEPIWNSADSWKITPVRDYPAFLRALPDLVPEGSMLYIESGGLPPEDVRAYLEARQAEEGVKIGGGTILPTPNVYCMPITRENVLGLAELEEKHPAPIGAIHVHVYRAGKILLMAYDAFMDPFWISREIPKDKVLAFCDRLGTRIEGDAEGV